MDPPTPWVSWAATLWAARLNQNLLHPDTAPIARPLEERAFDWLAPFFGMGGGQLVPGSTLAHLTALWAARDLRGVDEIVASEAAHLSVRVFSPRPPQPVYLLVQPRRGVAGRWVQRPVRTLVPGRGCCGRMPTRKSALYSSVMADDSSVNHMAEARPKCELALNLGRESNA